MFKETYLHKLSALANTIKNLLLIPTGSDTKTLAVDKIIERAKAQSAIARSKNKVKNTVTEVILTELEL